MNDRKNKDDDPFAFKTLANKAKDLISEYGSSNQVRFLDPECITTTDEEGEEICIPKCQKCRIHKCQLIGQNAYMWFCASCGSQ